ncbi:hypothetical protein JZ751_005019 [Albula glossodonta]|uniref:Uncharacterized protein n=1 Tax=Albula glossodonta TaxID=121402 RepID=A0A8T2PCU5_9TELE|nr:hypothetical protein JZ751_005019 [Albula glossodonta]
MEGRKGQKFSFAVMYSDLFSIHSNGSNSFLLLAFLSSPRPCGDSVAVSRVLKVARGAAAETKMLKLWMGHCHN